MFRRNLKSKTFWAGLAALVGAIGSLMLGEVSISDAIQIAVPALLAMFLRDGVEKIKIGSGK